MESENEYLSTGYADATETEPDEAKECYTDDGGSSDASAECNCGETMLLDVKTIPYPIRLSSRRRTAIDELRERIPIPRSAVPPLHYPTWPTVPLDRKLPGGVPAPRGAVVFARGTLGRKLHRRPKTYSVSDPRHQRRVITDYDSLHDPHARNYLCKPTVKNLLLKQGLITPEGHVKCSLKQFNHYREYLSTIYNQCLEDYVHDNDAKWRKEFECNRELRLYTAGKKHDTKRRSILEKLRKKKVEEYRRLRAKQEREEARRSAFEKAQYLRNCHTAMMKGQDSIRRRIKVNRAIHRRRLLDSILLRAVLEKDVHIAERRRCDRMKEEGQRNLFLTEWAIAKCVNQLQRLKTDDLVERSIRQDLKSKVCKRLDRTDQKCYALFPFRECRGIYEERLKKDRAKQEERVEFLMRKYFYIWLNKVRYSCRIDAAHTSLWNIQDELRRDAVLMCNFCDQTCPPNSAVEAIMKLRPQRNMFGGTPALPPQLQQKQSQDPVGDQTPKAGETPTNGPSSASVNAREVATAPAGKRKELHADCVLCLPMSKRSKSAGPSLFGIETLMKCTRYGVLKPHKLHPCECGSSPGSAYSTLIKFWKQQKTQMREHLCGKCIEDISVPKFCIPPEYASQRGCKPFTFPTCPPSSIDYSPCYSSSLPARRCETHPQLATRKSSTARHRQGKLPLHDRHTQGERTAHRDKTIQSGSARNKVTQQGRSVRADRSTQGQGQKDVSQQSMPRSAREDAAQTTQAQKASTAAGDQKIGNAGVATGTSTEVPQEKDEECEEDPKPQQDETESQTEPVETGVMAKRFKASSRKKVRCKDRIKATKSVIAAATSQSRLNVSAPVSACSSASKTGLTSASQTSSPGGPNKPPSENRGTQKKASPVQSAKVGTTMPGKSASIGTDNEPSSRVASGTDADAFIKSSGTQISGQPAKFSEGSGPSSSTTGTGAETIPSSDKAEGGNSAVTAGVSTDKPRLTSSGTDSVTKQSSGTDAFSKNLADSGVQLPRPPHSAPAATGSDREDDASQTRRPDSASSATQPGRTESTGAGTAPGEKRGAGTGTEGPTSASTQAGPTGGKDAATEGMGRKATSEFGGSAGPSVDAKGVGAQPDAIDRSIGTVSDRKDGSTDARSEGVDKSASARLQQDDAGVTTQSTGLDKGTAVSPEKTDGSTGAKPGDGTDKSAFAKPQQGEAGVVTQSTGVDKESGASPEKRDGSTGAKPGDGLDKSATALPSMRDGSAGAQPSGRDTAAGVSPETQDTAVGVKISDGIDESTGASPGKRETGAGGQPGAAKDKSVGASAGTAESGVYTEPSGVDESVSASPAKSAVASTTEPPGTSKSTGVAPDTATSGTVAQPGSADKSVASDAPSSRGASTDQPSSGAVGTGPITATESGASQTGKPGVIDKSTTQQSAPSTKIGTVEPQLQDQATDQPVDKTAQGSETTSPNDKTAQVNTVNTPTETGAVQTDQTGISKAERVDRVVSTVGGVTKIDNTASTVRRAVTDGATTPKVTPSVAHGVKKSISFKDFNKKDLKSGVQKFDRPSVTSLRSVRPSSAPPSARPSTIPISPSLRASIHSMPAEVRKSISQHLSSDRSRPIMKVELPKRFTSISKPRMSTVGIEDTGEALETERDPTTHVPQLVPRKSAAFGEFPTGPGRDAITGSEYTDDGTTGTAVEDALTDTEGTKRSRAAGEQPSTSTTGTDSTAPEVGTAATGETQEYQDGEVPGDRLDSAKDDWTGTNIVGTDKGDQTGIIPKDDHCLNNVTQAVVGDIIDAVASDFGLPPNEFEPCCLDEQDGKPVCTQGEKLKDICCSTCGGAKVVTTEAPVLPMTSIGTSFTPNDAQTQAHLLSMGGDVASQATPSIIPGEPQIDVNQPSYSRRRDGETERGKAHATEATVRGSETNLADRATEGTSQSGIGSGPGFAPAEPAQQGVFPSAVSRDGRMAGTGAIPAYAPSAVDAAQAEGYGPNEIRSRTDAAISTGFPQQQMGVLPPGTFTNTGVDPRIQLAEAASQSQSGQPLSIDAAMNAGSYGIQMGTPVGVQASPVGRSLMPGFTSQAGEVPTQAYASQPGMHSMAGYAAQSGMPTTGYSSQASAMPAHGFVQQAGIPQAQQSFGPQAGFPSQAQGSQVPGPPAQNYGFPFTPTATGQGLPTAARSNMPPHGYEMGPSAGSQVSQFQPQSLAYGSQFAPSALPQGSRAPPGLSQQMPGIQQQNVTRTGTLAPENRVYGTSEYNDDDSAIEGGKTFAETAAPYKQQLVEKTMAQMKNAAAQHPLGPTGYNTLQTKPSASIRLRKPKTKDGNEISATNLSKRKLRGAYRGCCTHGPLIPMCDENLPMIEEIYVQSREVTPLSDLLAERALRRAINAAAGPCDPSFIEGPLDRPPRGGGTSGVGSTPGSNKATPQSKDLQAGDSDVVKSYVAPATSQAPPVPPASAKSSFKALLAPISQAPQRIQASSSSSDQRSCGQSYIEIRQKIEILRARLQQFKQQLSGSGISCAPAPVGTTQDNPPPPPPPKPNTIQSYTVETVITSIRPQFDPEDTHTKDIIPLPSSLTKRVQLPSESLLDQPQDLTVSFEEKKKFLESAGFSVENSPGTSSIEILFPQRLSPHFDAKTNVDPETLTLLLNQAGSKTERTEVRGRIESMRAQLEETRESLRHKGILPEKNDFPNVGHSSDQKSKKKKNAKENNKYSTETQQSAEPDSKRKKKKKK